MELIIIENAREIEVTCQDSETISMEKKYGLKFIDIGKLKLITNPEILSLSTILNDDNKETIDISKINNILISLETSENRIITDRENILKEYCILTMNENNSFLKEGKVCSFLNSTCRTILFNYLKSIGLIYEEIQNEIDQIKEIKLYQYQRNRKSMYRKLIKSLSAIFSVGIANLSSALIENESPLDQTFMDTLR